MQLSIFESRQLGSIRPHMLCRPADGPLMAQRSSADAHPARAPAQAARAPATARPPIFIPPHR